MSISDNQRMIDLQINFLLNQEKLDATLGGMNALQVGLENIQKQEEAELQFQQQQAAADAQALERINAMVQAYNAQAAAQAAANQQAAASIQALAAADQEFAQHAQSSAEAMDEWNQQVKDANLQPLEFSLNEVISLFNAEAQAAKEAAQATKDSMADLNPSELDFAMGGGGAGGDTGEGDGGGAGGGGSLYGVARGLRAGAGIGRIAGAGGATTTALTGAADLLYLEQAGSKLSEIIAGMGISFETLFTAAAPIVVAIGAIAFIMQDLTEKAKEATKEAKAFGEALKEAVPTAVGGSVTGIQQAEAKAAQDAIVQQATKEAELNDIRRQAAKANTEIGTAISKLSDDQILHSGLLQKTYAENFKSIDAATQAAQKDTDVENYLAQSQRDQATAANTAAEAARNYAQAHIAQAAQFASDDKASYQADQGKVDDLHSSVQSINESIAAIQKTNGDPNLAPEQLQKNKEAIAALTAERAREEDEIKHLIDVSEPYAQKRDAMAAADVQYLKQIDDGLAQVKQATADAKLSSQANADKTAALKEDRAATEDAIKALEAHSIVTDADQKKLDALIAKMQDYDTEIKNLQDDFHPAQIREAADAVKKATDAYDKAMRSIQDNLTNSINDAQAKERYAELQYTPGSLQDTAQRTDIALKEQRDVSKVEEDTANKIVDIRTKLGDTEAKLVTDYNRQLFDDQIKYQDSLEKLQIDAQRTAQQDAINHAQKIADINQALARNELQDVADRNFQKLATDMQAASDQRQKADEQYTDQEQALQRHLANQEADLTRSLAQQEAKQQLDEGRKIADAETAADNQIAQEHTTEKRKIEALKDSEKQQLDDLTRHELDKISLLRQNAVQEISMLQIQANNRENIAAATEAQIIAQADAILKAGTNAFIDDLNRLNALANGSSGGSTAPSPSSQYFQLNPQSSAVPSAPTQSSSQAFDPAAAVNTIVSTVVSGLQQGLGNLFAP